MGFRIVKTVREDPALRESFDRLAREVFGLSFAAWHQDGYWTDRYRPYVLVDGDRVAANVSVNLMDTVWRGARKRYVQLGTVMTHPDHRGRGLARQLMEEVLRDWTDACDGVYLYANDRVLDFYPKFGFRPAREYQWNRQVERHLSGDWVPLPMGERPARERLEQCYRLGNPYGLLPMLDNVGLLQFYCTGGLKDCVYWSQRLHAVCIAGQEGETVTLYDVFGSPVCGLAELLDGLPFSSFRRVELGFAPMDTAGFERQPLGEEDTTLFVLDGREYPFDACPVRMPALSHA